MRQEVIICGCQKRSPLTYMVLKCAITSGVLDNILTVCRSPGSDIDAKNPEQFFSLNQVQDNRGYSGPPRNERPAVRASLADTVAIRAAS